MYNNEFERHEQYKKYAKLAYGLKLNNLPKDKIALYKSENKNNGFSAYSIKDGDRIVIVYAGTNRTPAKEFKKDLKNDINMGIENIPAQAKDALRFYDQMKEKYKGMKIDVVGESLGGSLGQYVATQREVNQAVNFNPYGTGKSQNEYLSKYESKTPMDRIINYNNSKDIISDTWSKNTQVGTNYSIETDKTKASFLDPLKHHKSENMMPLGTSKQGNPSYDIEGNKPVIKSAPKPAWDKHGNLTGFATEVNKNNTAENDSIKNNSFSNINTNNLNDNKFKTNTFDLLKKDMPYIDNINSINKPEQNKNTSFTNQTNNKTPFTPIFTPTPTPTFADLVKKSSALNNNVSIDNKDLIYKNSTFGGIEDDFLNKIRGKRFQDLTDEERLKALWFYTKK